MKPKASDVLCRLLGAWGHQLASTRLLEIILKRHQKGVCFVLAPDQAISIIYSCSIPFNLLHLLEIVRATGLLVGMLRRSLGMVWEKPQNARSSRVLAVQLCEHAIYPLSEGLAVATLMSLARQFLNFILLDNLNVSQCLINVSST